MYFADDPAFGPALVFGYQQFFRVRPSDQEVIEDKEVLLQCQVANQAGLVQVIHLLKLLISKFNKFHCIKNMFCRFNFEKTFFFFF
jgi:hypothetical protein